MQSASEGGYIQLRANACVPLPHTHTAWQLVLSYTTHPTALTDCDVSIRALQHLVHALGAQRRAQCACYCLGCQDVCLDSLCAPQPRLAALILQSWRHMGA